MTENSQEIERLISEIERIAHDCYEQRLAFHDRAIRFSRLSKVLNIVAGLLSLIAAGSIAGVLVKLLNPTVMQIIAVVSAITSALISGIIYAFLNEKHIGKYFSAAAFYLQIREDAKSAILTPKISANTLHKRLEELQNAYIKGSQLFGELGIHSGGSAWRKLPQERNQISS